MMEFPGNLRPPSADLEEVPSNLRPPAADLEPRAAATDESSVARALAEHREEIRRAIVIRTAEQRLLRLFADGKLFGTVHTCVGQEMVGLAVARALRDGDTIFSNHRCHGHYLAYRDDLVGLLGEIMGKSVGVCGGRGGSQHLHHGGFFSNGVQGGIAPVSVGMALAHARRKAGNVAVVYLGDGTLGQGAVYESMNIASKWDLPVLYVCEHNRYAQSTSAHETIAGDVAARAAAFGIQTAHGDTWRWQELFTSMEDAIATVRRTGRPFFHLVDTYRLNAHSKGDDLRSEDELSKFRALDPVNILLGSGSREIAAMQADAEAAVERAVAIAEAAPFGTVPAMDIPSRTAPAWTTRTFDKERGVASVRRGLTEGFRAHDRLLLIGEDVESPYGGAFKCTAGLSAEFPGRVRNTPISELCIVGMGNGLALSGFVPVVEIMFGDFLTLATDQWINHAAKFQQMYGDGLRVPLIVRTPMGGKRGYAATHSQSLEKHYLGVPGTQVLCLNHRVLPADVYATLFATASQPTLVIENKILYGKEISSEPPPGFSLIHTDEPFPTARLRPQGRADVTVVAVGGMSLDAEEAVKTAFLEHEIACDLFLPTKLYPFDVAVLEESLSATKRLVVVEEGQGFASFSSELVAQATERWGARGLSARRVVAAPVAIPAARPLEEQCLPQPSSIVAALVEVVRG